MPHSILEGEKRLLEARRERLELPAIDREMLASIVDNFEKVMAEGPNPKKKHLLHQFVKKVHIQSRQTIEIWYMLPNTRRFADCNIMAPQVNRSTKFSRPIHSVPPAVNHAHSGYYNGENPPMCRSTNRQPEPEVWFRIVHIAQEDHNGGSVAACREQTVEIALGPKGAFENANVGALTRRAPPDQMLSVVLPGRGDPKPPREPKTPRVVELLRKAVEWKALLESGQITTQAALACQESITRARVTQILGMLRLAPEIQERILSLPDTIRRRAVTERMLRPIKAVANHRDQLREFKRFLS